MQPKISICIPAYNRAHVLGDLLDSILAQDFDKYEIVICEDHSPQRVDIRNVVDRYMELRPGVIRYFENPKNLGYDGNLRRLIELASGKYVLFMGNDDLLAPQSLSAIANVVNEHQNIGVVLRSYSSFFDSPENAVQVFRYFDGNRFFPSGAEAIKTFFRRSVFISGMVVKRDSALKVATNQFDGTLLYQQHLVGQILMHENGFYLHDIVSYHRLGGIPDFGNSEVEKGTFVPKDQTPESSVAFVNGMINIAKSFDVSLGQKIGLSLIKDIGNYAYPILSIQAKRSLPVFLKYIFQIAKLGLWRVPLFYVYALGLIMFGVDFCDALIAKIKKHLGRAPALGAFASGDQA